MRLALGDKLRPYEIFAPIGADDMVEVYGVKDTKPDPEVAVKVPPAAVAHDRERFALSERETKVPASLDHTNIAQIYGLAGSGETRTLVTERKRN